MLIFSALLAILFIPLSLFASSPAEAYTFSYNWTPPSINIPTPPTFVFPTITPPTFNFPTSTRTTPTPTIKPTATPTSTPQPTVTPTKTPTPQPTVTIIPTVATSPIASTKDYIMQQINNFRQSKGLYMVKTDPYTCSFAKIRAQEISAGFNHDGFTSRINSKTLPYPSYQRVTENLAMTSSYKNVVSMWANSPGHAANMSADTPYVCVESYGNYYAYEGWKP